MDVACVWHLVSLQNVFQSYVVVVVVVVSSCFRW